MLLSSMPLWTKTMPGQYPPDLEPDHIVSSVAIYFICAEEVETGLFQ
uniref:Uncharacterized protein n=1 Tax=Anguilla anguilla TaxID=7936 RepID=A0A0E9R359_ANGAN